MWETRTAGRLRRRAIGLGCKGHVTNISLLSASYTKHGSRAGGGHSRVVTPDTCAPNDPKDLLSHARSDGNGRTPHRVLLMDASREFLRGGFRQPSQAHHKSDQMLKSEDWPGLHSLCLVHPAPMKCVIPLCASAGPRGRPRQSHKLCWTTPETWACVLQLTRSFSTSVSRSNCNRSRFQRPAWRPARKQTGSTYPHRNRATGLQRRCQTRKIDPQRAGG